jgi:hypothetical protein
MFQQFRALCCSRKPGRASLPERATTRIHLAQAVPAVPGSGMDCRDETAR